MDGEELDTNKSTTETEEEHSQIVQPSDEENISQLPSTSSSQVNFSSKQTAAPLCVSTAIKSSSHGAIVHRPLIGNQPLSSSDGQERASLSSQLKINQKLSSRRNVSAPKGPTSSQNVNNPSSRPNPSTQIRAPLRAVAPTPGTTSKEISVDAIRNKMDSCLNAMANKITDKAHRSPHAPFLAYLGTKLPNIPQEIIPSVEEEILEIVKFYSVRQNGRGHRNE